MKTRIPIKTQLKYFLKINSRIYGTMGLLFLFESFFSLRKLKGGV